MNKLSHKIKAHYEVILIFLAGLAMRLYMARIDPFLHEWDERYHALVAKNMMTHPFKPMLIAQPITFYDPEQWCCNHIWLHKQPLFLWQMALSMKLFGVSEFTMRLPSVLMGSIMILMIYRITMLLTANKLTAILSALLLCFSYYQLELTSGRYGMDHNDIAFGFYILAGTWSYMEYRNKPKWYWAVLTGLFAGCAILNKWLTGLLVFLFWGLKVILVRNERKGREIGHFILSLVVCVLIFLPWQLFILHAYPNEARIEYALNTRHLWEVVENHAWNNWLYYDHFESYFGQTNYYLLIPGIVILLLKYPNKRIEALSLCGMFVLLFVFFTFIVQTKIVSYFFVIAPVGMILIAVAFKELLAIVRYNKRISAALIGICLFKALNPLDIIRSRQNNIPRKHMILRTEIYKNLHHYMPGNIHLLINLPAFEHVDVMFYNDGITANHYWLSEAELAVLTKGKTPLATFKDHYDYAPPEYIKRYPYLYVLDVSLEFPQN